MKIVVYILIMILLVKAKEVWEPKKLSEEYMRSLPVNPPDEGIGMLKNLIRLIYEYDFESRNSSILMDIGANIGKVTKWMADIYLNSKIYSFEPFKLSLDVLKMKTSNNPNVEIVVEAVSNVTTLNQPFYSVPTWSNPMNTMSSLSSYLNDSSIVEYSNTTTLSYFMERKNISNIFFIKIDAEGYDGIIINDSMKMFYEHKIKYLYFEYIHIWKSVDPNLKLYEILNHLILAGYNIYFDYNGNFVSLKEEQIYYEVNGLMNILAILKGEPFERSLMKRLCPLCGY